MTVLSRTAIKGLFEDGDTPQGSDYSDWVDSFVHLTDSTAQTVTSPMTLGTVGATTVSAALVSANNVNGSAANFSTVSAQRIVASACVFQTVTFVQLSAQRVNGSAATFLATVSAATIHTNTLIINSDATAAVSAAASAARYVLVTVSGTSYWLPLFAQ